MIAKDRSPYEDLSGKILCVVDGLSLIDLDEPALGVFFELAICSRKRHVKNSRIEEEMGRVKGSGPLPAFLLSPSHRP